MTRKQMNALIATTLGSGVVFLDGSIVNLALPHIADSFHTTFAGLQWIVDGYLLTLSALILVGGSLGDILGRKKVYMLGLTGFGVVSLLCGLSLNTNMLVGLRLLQGVFGALLVPGALAIINTNFAPEERSAAFGKWTAFSAITAAIGPLAGGYLINIASWRWIFLLNVPIITLCVYLGGRGIKESKDPAHRKIDYFGALLAVIGLGGLTLGLIDGPADHWQTRSVGAIIAGVIAIGLFLFNERRTPDPMVKLALFKSRNFTAANIATFAMYGALGGFFFIFLIYMQQTVGFSALKAGLSMLPISIFLMLFSSRVGRLAGVYGSRLFMTFGPLIAATGLLLLSGLGKGDSFWLGVLPGVTLFSIGLTLNVAPLTTTIMSSVKENDSGIASGVNNAVSRVSGLLVIAVLGLFGASKSYHYTIILCTLMAAAAGILSFILVDNNATRASRKKALTH